MTSRYEEAMRLFNAEQAEHAARVARIERANRWRVLAIAVATALALCAGLFAQTVGLANYSGAPFDGWKRCTVDVMPPHAAGQVGATRYVLGRQVGLDAKVIDLKVHLDPGEVRTVDLSAATPWAFTRGPLPADPLAFFGAPTIAGVPLRVVELQADGAGYLAHLQARVGPMLHCDLWCWWQPDVPGWCQGEVVVTASNPLVPDVTATVPDDLRLRFGACDVLVPGLPFNAPLLPVGELLGDGQARSFPCTLVWRQHLQTPDQWTSAGAAAAMAISANGISRLYPDGNPLRGAGLAPLAWSRGNFAGAVSRLHGWEAGPLGVTERSQNTGAQEEQILPGAECMQGVSSLGAETVRYLVALGQSRRPCQHLEPSGAQLNPFGHPRCVFWSSRPHWHTGVSPDQLGKSRSLTELDSHGWSGPDREHWLEGTVNIAARMTGSPALQWQLSAQARNFLMGETVTPGLSTSGADAARSVGYAGLLVALLHLNLEDRALEAQVAERWRQRVLQVYIPQCSSRPGDVWDPRPDDRILQDLDKTKYASGVMWWQQALGAYGLDLGCAAVGPPEGRALALRAAKSVLDHAFTQDASGRWTEWDNTAYLTGGGILPASEMVEGKGAHRTGWFGIAWFPCAPATVLRQEPNNEKARAIWQQMLRDARGGGPWFPMGVAP